MIKRCLVIFCVLLCSNLVDASVDYSADIMGAQSKVVTGISVNYNSIPSISSYYHYHVDGYTGTLELMYYVAFPGRYEAVYGGLVYKGDYVPYSEKKYQ